MQRASPCSQSCSTAALRLACAERSVQPLERDGKNEDACTPNSRTHPLASDAMRSHTSMIRPQSALAKLSAVAWATRASIRALRKARRAEPTVTRGSPLQGLQCRQCALSAGRIAPPGIAQVFLVYLFLCVFCMHKTLCGLVVLPPFQKEKLAPSRFSSCPTVPAPKPSPSRFFDPYREFLSLSISYPRGGMPRRSCRSQNGTVEVMIPV